MLETPHVALGMAIAVKIGNPYLAIPIAFTSHFLLDKVPHWNPHFYTEKQKGGRPSSFSTAIAIADELVAIALTLFVAYTFLPNTTMSMLILICSFMSVLSDQIKFPYFFFNVNGLIKKWVLWERTIQVEIGPFWGMVTQLITLAASLFWIYS